MTYYNPVQHFGHSRFAASLTASGIDGAIIPDLPLDGRLVGAPWRRRRGAGVGRRRRQGRRGGLLLAALTTPEDRLAAICARSRGFVYGVSLLGVTGGG